MQEPLASPSDERAGSKLVVPKKNGQQPVVKIFCKGDPSLNVAARGEKVILVPNNDEDKSQHWIQDFDVVPTLTDDQGRKAFALVNETTGQALLVDKDNCTIHLVPYSGPLTVEVSMLWSMGVDLDDGYTEIRMLRDTNYTLNGLNGHVQEGTIVGVYSSEPTSINAVWKLDPIPIK